MPAFLVFLAFFLMVKWLGWWLLAIVLGIAATIALVLWWEKAVKSTPYVVPSMPTDAERLSKESTQTVRIEINSVRADGNSETFQRVVSVGRASTEASPTVALVVKNDPLERILAGKKTWEMRAQHTRKREMIALAKKGSGMIYGVAEIVDSRGPLSDETMRSTASMHGIDPSRIDQPEVYKYRYAWVLENVRRLRQPVPYSHTKGAQSFVILDPGTISAVRSQLGHTSPLN